MEAIDSLHGKMTLIIIVHRLTTIKNCDVIYEIADGKAVSRAYEELVQEAGEINKDNEINLDSLVV